MQLVADIKDITYLDPCVIHGQVDTSIKEYF